MRSDGERGQLSQLLGGVFKQRRIGIGRGASEVTLGFLKDRLLNELALSRFGRSRFISPFAYKLGIQFNGFKRALCGDMHSHRVTDLARHRERIAPMLERRFNLVWQLRVLGSKIHTFGVPVSVRHTLDTVADFINLQVRRCQEEV